MPLELEVLEAVVVQAALVVKVELVLLEALGVPEETEALVILAELLVLEVQQETAGQLVLAMSMETLTTLEVQVLVSQQNLPKSRMEVVL